MQSHYHWYLNYTVSWLLLTMLGHTRYHNTREMVILLKRKEKKERRVYTLSLAGICHTHLPQIQRKCVHTLFINTHSTKNFKAPSSWVEALSQTSVTHLLSSLLCVSLLPAGRGEKEHSNTWAKDLSLTDGQGPNSAYDSKEYSACTGWSIVSRRAYHQLTKIAGKI